MIILHLVGFISICFHRLADLQCQRKPSDIAEFLNVIFHNIAIAQSTSKPADHNSMSFSRNRSRSVPRRDGPARSKRYIWRPLHSCKCLLRPSGERDAGFTILHLQHDNFELVPYINRSRGAKNCSQSPHSSLNAYASMLHQEDPSEHNLVKPAANTNCHRKPCLQFLKQPVSVKKAQQQLQQKIYRLSNNDAPVSSSLDTGKRRLSLSGLRHHPHIPRIRPPSGQASAGSHYFSDKRGEIRRQGYYKHSCLISGQLRPWGMDSPANEHGGLPRIPASTRLIAML